MNDAAAVSASTQARVAFSLAAFAIVRFPLARLGSGQRVGDRAAHQVGSHPLAPLARAVGRRAKGAALFGAVATKLAEFIDAYAPQVPRARCHALNDAFAWCFDHSQTGDALLLSPACASLDQFRDYAERGERFVQLVHGLSVVSCQPSMASGLS